MRLWYALTARLRSLCGRGQRERDLAEEFRLHIEREIERHVANGVDAETARRTALREFGAIESLKEECRDARGTTVIDHLRRDTRHATRRLVRDWRFTVPAILILALGIGANTAVFSVVNAALFREAPLVNPDRLVEIYQNDRSGAPLASSYPAYLDISAYTEIFAGVTAVSVPDGVRWRDRGPVRDGAAEYTTPSYPAVLGLRPFLGRWFTEQEDRPGAPLVAVVGHQAWTTRFGADPTVIGRTIRIQGLPATIVGIGPAGYRSTFNVGLVTEFWLPASHIPALSGMPGGLDRLPAEAPFFVKARLREGATVAQARAAMDVLGRRLATEYPKEDPGRGITVMAARDVRVHPQMDVLLRTVASVLLGVVALLLAITCSNLATLLLVRASARGKEVSVRLAVGATRWQIVRHLLAESVLLAVAGGAAGCVLAWWLIRSLGAVELPITVDLRLDYAVLGFALALSVATGVLFGLAPALKATRLDLVSVMREDGQTRSAGHRRFTLRNALVVFQVSASVVLLATTGVFLQIGVAARAQRLGFAVESVATLETDMRYSGYSAAQGANLFEDLRRRVAAIPGVQAAVLTRGQPMDVTGLSLIVEGAPADAGTVVVAGSIWAGPGFFDVMQIPMVSGRAIDERDRSGAPRVAVISQTMARQYFGEANAIGRRFRLEHSPDWIEVIGVARDTGTADLGDIVDPIPQLFFRPFDQAGLPPTTVLARTSLDASDLVGAMQRELLALDPTLPVFEAQTVEQMLEESLVDTQTVSICLGVLGAFGMVLAGIGLYAVIAFAVSRRAREIGIRMALGARAQDVVTGVAREAAALLGAGAGVGLTLAMLVILAMRSFSNPAPGVGNIGFYRPTLTPLPLLAIVAFIIVVGLAAACLPARRAARMNALSALRHD